MMGCQTYQNFLVNLNPLIVVRANYWPKKSTLHCGGHSDPLYNYNSSRVKNKDTTYCNTFRFQQDLLHYITFSQSTYSIYVSYDFITLYFNKFFYCILILSTLFSVHFTGVVRLCRVSSCTWLVGALVKFWSEVV